MIKLIVTASDELYQTLSAKTRADGHIPHRAYNALQGLKQATRLGKSRGDPGSAGVEATNGLSGIVVDMSLHAADTLLETLHSRQGTWDIPLVAVKCDGQVMPLSLRRLCTNILDMDESAPLEGQTMSDP